VKNVSGQQDPQKHPLTWGVIAPQELGPSTLGLVVIPGPYFGEHRTRSPGPPGAAARPRTQVGPSTHNWQQHTFGEEGEAALGKWIDLDECQNTP
jgi:hypothetical protein